MILFRRFRGGRIRRKKLEASQQGFWLELFRGVTIGVERAYAQSVRRRRRQCVDEERRVTRASSLVHMEELSAARSTRRCAHVPGTISTPRALTDHEVEQSSGRDQPLEQFELNSDEFLIWAAAGLVRDDESERASKFLTEVAGFFSVRRGVRCIPEAGRWCERDCLGRHHPKSPRKWKQPRLPSSAP